MLAHNGRRGIELALSYQGDCADFEHHLDAVPLSLNPLEELDSEGVLAKLCEMDFEQPVLAIVDCDAAGQAAFGGFVTRPLSAQRLQNARRQPSPA